MRARLATPLSEAPGKGPLLSGGRPHMGTHAGALGHLRTGAAGPQQAGHMPAAAAGTWTPPACRE